MTSSQMLTRVRTLLDEASAGLWSDNEIYSALTDGQKSIAEFLVSFYKKRGMLPKILLPLVTYLTGGLTVAGQPNVPLPSDFMYLVSLEYDPDNTGKKPCIILEDMERNKFLANNSYFSAVTPSDSFYIAYYDIDSSSNRILHCQPDNSGLGSYYLNYLKYPTDINASTDPILAEGSHEAIVQYAYIQLLLKDEKSREAYSEFNKFTAMLPNLIY